MKNVISVDSILEDLMGTATLWYIEKITEKEFAQAQDDATKALYSLLISKLPEKVKLATSVYQNEGDGNASERIGYKHGYNDCREDMRKSIDELFGVQK